MNEDKEVAAELEAKDFEDTYLPCVHQRIAARLLQHFQCKEKREELVELSATWQ